MKVKRRKGKKKKPPTGAIQTVDPTLTAEILEGLRFEDIKVSIVDRGATLKGRRREIAFEVVSPDSERVDKAAMRLRFFMDMILRMMAGMEPPTNDEIPPELGLESNPIPEAPKPTLEDLIRNAGGGELVTPAGLILPGGLVR